MLQNEFNGGLARYTAKVAIGEHWVVFFNKICTCWAFYRPRANFFCSEWRNSRLWRDSRVILCNQKSVFTQSPTTWLLQHRLEREWWKAKHHFPALFAWKVMQKKLYLAAKTLSCSATICCKRSRKVMFRFLSPTFKHVLQQSGCWKLREYWLLIA